MDKKNEISSRGLDRGEQTRIQLIEAAESLFAQEGIDAVSLRRIGTSIGSANTNIVGYHFGTKSDLINEIFEYRLHWLDVQRAELYRQCVEAGECDMVHLHYALWWPFYQQTNAVGLHSYAGFLSELMRSGHGSMRRAVRANFPAVETILAEIRALVSALDTARFEQRLNAAAIIVTACLRRIDIAHSGELTGQQREAMFLDSIGMAAAAMSSDLNFKPPQN